MQTGKPGQIHVGNGSGHVPRHQNIPQLGDMFRVYAARVVLFKQPFQSFVANCPDHRTLSCATWRMTKTTAAQRVKPTMLQNLPLARRNGLLEVRAQHTYHLLDILCPLLR